MMPAMETAGAAETGSGSIPGWYGKLPSLGDFASRRLGSEFIDPWDRWLGERLQGLRESSGEAWLQSYLHSPPWRFLLMPGVLPGARRSAAMAGVLMPSVDRVGRYFPLTLAARLPGAPVSMADVAALLAWLQRLEDTGLDALQGDWSIDALEDALAGLAPPGQDGSGASDDALAAARRELAAAVAGGGGSIEFIPAASRQDLASAISGALGPTAPRTVASLPDRTGVALWLADRPSHQHVLATLGLPAVADFRLMFGGSVAEPAPFVPPTWPDGPAAASLFAGSGEALAPNPPAVIPEDADLLGLFGATDTPKRLSLPDRATGDAPDPLFGPAVGAEAAPDDETRPGDHDILAMFDARPEAAPESKKDDTRPVQPDILDLFGASAPDGNKTI
jgi:type VI secretion system protein ImpM